ncbi:MAG: DNA mismatch repair endonuclease MutL [Clostridia bacterium]|nr:DNA mismatch repair endonuclease MutL [Clostridia bacterium]
MAKINVLDKHTAELIAAGEVVERPASAIKELIENSIDAGASAITVEIKNGGNTFMRITDNGCGIERDDIKNAFLRHATSKIKTEDDLNRIETLGFRGEALASICAVAKVELLTRTADCDMGTKYVIHGGEEIEFEDAGCAIGTTIVVRDLFYNTPARMKFLKKDVTESNAVTAVVDRIALSHPEVSIKLIRDGKQVLLTPGDGVLRSAVFSVLGKEFADGLLPVDYEMNGVKVSGFTTKPTYSRANRNMQFFFLNGRYIRTKTVMAACEQAYKNAIMVGKFPGCLLNITLAADEVDVNVHPSKIEVRFADENKIFSAVYYAVKSAITADTTRVQFESKPDIAREYVAPTEQIKFTSVPTKPLSTPYIPEQKPYSPPPAKPSSYAIDFNREDVVTQKVEDSGFKGYNQLDIIVEDDVKEIAKAPEKPVVEEITPIKEKVQFKYIGEAFETYILVECDGKIIMIDKHAAHERILFEKIKADTEHQPQMLIAPICVNLSAEEYDAILTNLDEINSTGFEIEDYGSKSILVRGIPMELDGEDAKALIIEIAGKLNDKIRQATPEFLDWLYHSVACRAAIKAGNRSTAMELTALADEVLNNDNIRYCPHGRPVAAEMTLSEIKRRFSRI